jgi:hypothetical protein
MYFCLWLNSKRRLQTFSYKSAIVPVNCTMMVGLIQHIVQ